MTSELFGEYDYFYIVTDYTYTNSIETSTDANGETIYTTVRHLTPVKQVITEGEAIEYGLNREGYLVYIVYLDGTEEKISADVEEVLENLDYVPIPNTQSNASGSSGAVMKTTTHSISIDSISANSTFTTTATPTEESGYTLLGVIGHDFTGTSQIIIYRMSTSSGSVSLGLRNISSSDLTSKTLTLTLLWGATASVSITESE